MDIAKFKDEFHRLLGRLVRTQSVFDFNVGLQLLNCEALSQEERSELLNPCTTQLRRRLVALDEMVRKTFHSSGGEAIAEFSAWFERADSCQALRNDYAHGLWGVPGKYELTEPGRAMDAIPQLTFRPLTWEMSADNRDDEVVLTLEEFAGQVEVAEVLISEYWDLCNKYFNSSVSLVATRELKSILRRTN